MKDLKTVTRRSQRDYNLGFIALSEFEDFSYHSALPGFEVEQVDAFAPVGKIQGESIVSWRSLEKKLSVGPV